MEDFLAIVPSRGAYVELARIKTGRVFRKQILTRGSLRHPVTGEPIEIDDAFVNKLVANFDGGVCDIVQVPLANDENQHVEAPERNIGEVIGLEDDGQKVFAIIDARKPEAAEALGKTLLGASAFMHTNYTNTTTGDKVGPTLLHVCVTNRPYVTGLDSYEELVAATSDGSGDIALLSAPEEPTMPQTLEELKASLKADHNIDVDALQLTATTKPTGLDPTALVKALVDAGALKLSAGTTAEDAVDQIGLDDVTGAVVELAQDNTKLSSSLTETIVRLTALEKDKTTIEVDGLVREGRILPVQRDGMLELALSNRTLFDKMVPDKAIVPLSVELGHGGIEDHLVPDDVQAAIDRYTAPGGVADRGGYVRATASK